MPIIGASTGLTIPLTGNAEPTSSGQLDAWREAIEAHTHGELAGAFAPVAQRGTWTPRLFFGGAEVAYTTQAGTYRKINTVLLLGFEVTWTAGALNPSITLENLPFTIEPGTGAERYGCLLLEHPFAATAAISVTSADLNIARIVTASGTVAALTGVAAGTIAGAFWYVTDNIT